MQWESGLGYIPQGADNVFIMRVRELAPSAISPY